MIMSISKYSLVSVPELANQINNSSSTGEWERGRKGNRKGLRHPSAITSVILKMWWVNHPQQTHLGYLLQCRFLANLVYGSFFYVNLTGPWMPRELDL